MGQSIVSDVHGVSGAVPWDPTRKQILRLTKMLIPFLAKMAHPRMHSSDDSKLEETEKMPA